MRALGELVVLAAVIALVAAIISAAARERTERARRWRVDTWTRPDGTFVVGLRRAAGEERVVRELPPGMDAAELAAELQLAREDAELAVRALNRP